MDTQGGNASTFAAQLISRMPRAPAFLRDQCDRVLLKEETGRIVVMVGLLLGNKSRVLPWLCQPRVGLGGEIPARLMRNLEGCAKVAQFVESLIRNEQQKAA